MRLFWQNHIVLSLGAAVVLTMGCGRSNIDDMLFGLEIDTDSIGDTETDTVPVILCEDAEDCDGFGTQCLDVQCVEGQCVVTQAGESTSCDDGNLCTENDVCNGFGGCEGQPLDCSSFDDQCNGGVCNAETGQCEPVAVEDGTTCDDGDLCTVEDSCQSGVCEATAKDCSAEDDQCNVGVCNDSTGECEATPSNEGNGCDDGDLCTVGDVCQSGLCEASPMDCSGLDDQCNVGTCNFLTGSCEAIPSNEGNSCDDGDLCTVGDVCQAGMCEATAKDCSAFDDQCNLGICDGLTGNCEAAPANEDDPCDDGDLCTVGDVCQAGVCESSAKDCSAFDDQCNLGVCDGLTGNCEAAPVNEDDPCDDGDLCTVADICQAGVCEASAKDCSAFDDQCNLGVCDGLTGNCEAAPANEDDPCDDGDLCTVGDICQAGVCEASAKDCSAFDDQCNLGVCDGLTGNCEAAPSNEGNGCDDGDLCTVGDVCQAGVCEASAKDCSAFDDQCNLGVCDGLTGNCEAAPSNEGNGCDDGDLCTVGDVCQAGACEASAKDCSAFDDQCTLGVCDGLTGNCEAAPSNEGSDCDDGDLCTVGDVCQAGACEASAKDCSAFDDQCTLGVCDGLTGNCEAAPANEGNTCDDGNVCSVGDVCQAGSCEALPKDCSAFDDQCNAGVCDGETGNCQAAPINEGNTCDDGDLCSVGDVCVAGACEASPKDCSSINDDCNVGMCNVATGNCEPSFVNEGGTCDDGDLCSVGDVCSSGACVAAPKDCSALNDQCADGVCNAFTGDCEAAPVAEGVPCDDGDVCTVGDICESGLCVSTVKDCSYLDGQCNRGQCDMFTGNCEATPANEGGTCDDGDRCSENDVCASGVCESTPLDCSSLNTDCTLGVCDSLLGACESVNVNQGQTCDDGDVCTEGDACDAGVCISSPKDCSAFDDQCNRGACQAGTGLCFQSATNEGLACDDGSTCTTDEVCSAGECLASGDGYIFFEAFKNNRAGWTLDTEWEIGPATFASCYGTDPATDHTEGTTDNGIAGVVIGGCTGTSPHGDFCLMSPVIDTSGTGGDVWLSFWRWLGADYAPYMHSTVDVWDGAGWVNLFATAGVGTRDTAWRNFQYDITAYRSGATVVRWCYDIGQAGVWASSSWNIDDVTIASIPCTPVGNDSCGNDIVDGDDECDGPDLDGETCLSLGQPDGVLGCHADCSFDISECVL